MDNQCKQDIPSSSDINHQFDLASLPLDIICLILTFLTYEERNKAFLIVLYFANKAYQLHKKDNHTSLEAPIFIKRLLAADETTDPLHRLYTLYKGLAKHSQIFSGNMCSFRIFPDGSCYAWGNYNFGVKQNSNKTPQLFSMFAEEKIREIVLKDHAIFLTHSSAVYSCGNNGFGQLGFSKNENAPQLIPKLQNQKIIAIAAGLYHSVFLTADGKVYSCGRNIEGQLGLGQISAVTEPVLITSLKNKKIIAIAAGSFHSIFLTDEGNVYSCGSNDEGQLGLGHNINKKTPVSIFRLEDKKVIGIVAGSHHSIFLLDNGSIYSCGNNNQGQLGLGYTIDENIPKIINGFENQKVIATAAGSNHTIFLTANNQVYSCGRNVEEQLGIGKRNVVNAPQLIPGLKNQKVIAIAAGQNQSVFLTEDEKTYGCGSYGIFSPLDMESYNQQLFEVDFSKKSELENRKFTV